MKYGVILPPEGDQDEQVYSWTSLIRERIFISRRFLLIVCVPTLIVAAYYYIFAADLYQSESHFIVKSGNNARQNAGGFGQLLGLAGGASQSESEIRSVSDYLESHDVVSTLQSNLDLVAMFRRPEADILSRLWSDTPAPETLLKYYRGKVSVRYDSDTGITDLSVNTFRPADSYALARQLLALGEQRVNSMNERSYNDALASARRQLMEAESAAAILQSRMTGFRQVQRDIDPESSGKAQIQLVSEMNANLAVARSQLVTMGSMVSRSSPQYLALARQVRSLEGELAAQSAKLTGASSDIAGSLGGYEELKVRQEFAAKNYEAAAANLQRAIEEERRQKLYIVRVVQPNMPVKSLFPQRGKIVLTVFAGLMLAYSIGWLILAGVREHQA
jgi:capsular polysaccharide transport system permease protein